MPEEAFKNRDLHLSTFLKTKAKERMVADMFNKAKNFHGTLKHHQDENNQSQKSLGLSEKIHKQDNMMQS